MPKITDARRQARRDQIARAALEQFAVRGIHSTSMANIIEASGLSAGAIYTHFAGKDEIIAHVAVSTVSGVLGGVEGVLEADSVPPPAVLLALITERIAVAKVPVGFIVQAWAEAITNPTVRTAANEVYVEAYEFLREYSARWLVAGGGVDAAQAALRAPGRARTLLSLIYAYILQSSLIDDYSPAELLSDIASFD